MGTVTLSPYGIPSQCPSGTTAWAWYQGGGDAGYVMITYNSNGTQNVVSNALDLVGSTATPGSIVWPGDRISWSDGSSSGIVTLSPVNVSSYGPETGFGVNDNTYDATVDMSGGSSGGGGGSANLTINLNGASSATFTSASHSLGYCNDIFNGPANFTVNGISAQKDPNAWLEDPPAKPVPVYDEGCTWPTSKHRWTSRPSRSS